MVCHQWVKKLFINVKRSREIRSSMPVLTVGCSAFVVLDIRLKQRAPACVNTEVQVKLRG